jgi:hypothetical protein
MTTGEIIVVSFIALAALPIIIAVAALFLFGVVEAIVESWKALPKLFRILRGK